MTTDELLIHELAQRAGISVRTIRYYIEEGLLPQPTYQGKYSYYTLDYLNRLELIRRLKESYLPLREIRAIMRSLTDDQVKKRLKELPLPSPKFSLQQAPTQPAQKPGAKAVDYINRLMEDQTRYKTKGSLNQPQPAFSQDRNRLFHPEINQPDQAFTAEENWQRISLAPGVELHLRKPIDPDTESRVQQLIILAKKIFNIKP